jgi:hypothetical protein
MVWRSPKHTATCTVIRKTPEIGINAKKDGLGWDRPFSKAFCAVA